MERYEKCKEYVYANFSKIAYEPVRVAAFIHTNSVDNAITLLAISRGLKLELARIAALFHDYSQYVENCPHQDHARLSTLHANQYLKSTNLFKTTEIDDICFAIAQHSHKTSYDSPLCEALKDADVFARFLENPTIKMEGIRKERLLNACADIEKAKP